MAESPGVIEPYSRTVGLKEVRQCLRKQLTLFDTPGKAEEDQLEEIPRLWLLSVGDARTATDAYALGPREGWPSGFRFGPWGLELCVIVISELPKERGTLPLRLLGRGETLRQAVQEARQLPEGDPMRRPMVEVLAQRRFARLHFNDDEDRSEVEMLQEEFKKFKERIHDEGHTEGRLKGAAAVLRRQLEIRFGALPEDVSARLQAATQEQIDKWSERFVTADSLAAVFTD
jgi:hypothetical protein